MKIKVKFPSDTVIIDTPDVTEFIRVLSLIKCYERKGYSASAPLVECDENPTFEILKQEAFKEEAPAPPTFETVE